MSIVGTYAFALFLPSQSNLLLSTVLPKTLFSWSESLSACLPAVPSCPVVAKSPCLLRLWRQPLMMSEAAWGNFFHVWAGAFARPLIFPLFVTPAVSSLRCSYEKLWPVVKVAILGKRFIINSPPSNSRCWSRSLYNFQVIFNDRYAWRFNSDSHVATPNTAEKIPNLVACTEKCWRWCSRRWLWWPSRWHGWWRFQWRKRCYE